MPEYAILRQTLSSAEVRLAVHHAMLTDTEIKAASIEGLGLHAEALRSGRVLPIGSVEFVRMAMEVAGISEPASISYPQVLSNHLHREVRSQAAGNVLGRWFVKPQKTKAFTGFVFDSSMGPGQLPEHEREQLSGFNALPPHEEVWVSEPVVWSSEYRFYVLDGQALAFARYDDGPDSAPMVDESVVAEMLFAMASWPDAPCAFSLDVGVLASGETALVECNDAWALGYYGVPLDRGRYIEMLWRRWSQLHEGRRPSTEANRGNDGATGA